VRPSTLRVATIVLKVLLVIGSLVIAGAAVAMVPAGVVPVAGFFVLMGAGGTFLAGRWWNKPVGVYLDEVDEASAPVVQMPAVPAGGNVEASLVARQRDAIEEMLRSRERRGRTRTLN
jgi:hypothetical protein